jgi:hypothetical protein
MKKILFLLLFLPVSALRAQFPDFYIDLYYGNVQVQKQGQKKPVPAKMGMLLYAGDKLLLQKEGSRVSLVNKDYQYLELNKKGGYAVSDIKKMTFNTPHSVTKKYFELVWEELLDPKVISGRDKTKKIAGTWGGIIRGQCSVQQLPYDNTVTADYWVHFTWPAMKGVKQYRFSIYADNNRMVQQYLLTDTVFSISAVGLLKEEANKYYWQVESDEDASRQTCRASWTWLSAKEYQKQSEAVIAAIDPSVPHYLLAISTALFDKGFYALSQQYLLQTLEQSSGN